MRILAVIGVPGVGKTTFMRAMVTRLGGFSEPGRSGLCDFASTYKGRVIVLGRYDEGEIFAGTDRLSMAVQPDAENFVTALTSAFEVDSVMFEGDRLSNGAFLRHCSQKGELRVVKLEVKPGLLAARRAAREEQAGKAQDPQWRGGRESKVYNLGAAFSAETLWIDEPDQFDAGVLELSQWIAGQEVTKSVTKKAGRLF